MKTIKDMDITKLTINDYPIPTIDAVQATEGVRDLKVLEDGKTIKVNGVITLTLTLKNPEIIIDDDIDESVFENLTEE